MRSGIGAFAASLAKEAGKILLAHYGRIKKIRAKGVRDLVTDVDLLVERKVISRIRKKYPAHEILSEEGGIGAAHSEYKWIIDPLDGTHNYIFGFPIFGVCIALEHKGEIIVGVVNIPVLKELYVAEKGKGAYMNGRRIKVSSVRRLDKCPMVFESKLSRMGNRGMKQFAVLRKKVFNIRMFGAGCYELMLLASGRIGIFVVHDIKPWDVAAGFLIVREAGGTITDFKGKKCNVYTKSFVATNGRVHNQIMKWIG